MSGFDLSELLPFYLDETDEQIGKLNDSLLRLEADPSDSGALQETFRIVHSIKGSASVMGFESVNRLSHHLETLFDQLRSGRRVLDRRALELSFRSLDLLRDYHRALRQEGEGVDLTEPIEAVTSYLEESDSVPDPSARTFEEAPSGTEAQSEQQSGAGEEGTLEEGSSDAEDGVTLIVEQGGEAESEEDGPDRLAVTVTFDPALQWRDMKARLILNRLASRVRVLGSEPPADRLEEVESRSTFVAWVESDADRDEVRALAEVDGVSSIRFGVEADPVSEEGTESSESLPERGSTGDVAPTVVAVEGMGEGTGEAEVVVSQVKRKLKVAETLRVDVERLDHLMNLAGELVISRARFAELNAGLEELFRASETRLFAADSQERLDGLLEGLDAVLDPTSRSNGAVQRWRSQFRRLIESIRELRSGLERIRRGRDRLTEMTEAIDQLGRVCDGIQKGVLDTRMVPIGPLFERFRRVVRDLSVDSDKEVVLELQGESTELDKRMIDELSDPLIHMVRNAVDHGLEPPGVREAAGKPRAGRVTLSAAHRGNRVVITVSDDGKGLDVSRIRRKVIERGLLTEAEASRLDPGALIPYIFHAGLSTAESVTVVSGRGVGMDIVKDRIEQLNGSVAVRTEPGHGTTFTIRLPLTLAIMPSLLVRIHEEVYALPLGEIREIVEAGQEQVLDVQGGRAIEVRGRIIALVSLDNVFRWGGGQYSSPVGGRGRTSPAGRPVVVVQSTTATVGLVVDELIGIQEIVLKSIEKNYRAVHGLSGASILGNGRVALILDVDALIEMASNGVPGRPPIGQGAPAGEEGR